MTDRNWFWSQQSASTSPAASVPEARRGTRSVPATPSEMIRRANLPASSSNVTPRRSNSRSAHRGAGEYGHALRDSVLNEIGDFQRTRRASPLRHNDHIGGHEWIFSHEGARGGPKGKYPDWTNACDSGDRQRNDQ